MNTGKPKRVYRQVIEWTLDESEKDFPMIGSDGSKVYKFVAHSPMIVGSNIERWRSVAEMEFLEAEARRKVNGK